MNDWVGILRDRKRSFEKTNLQTQRVLSIPTCLWHVGRVQDRWKQNVNLMHVEIDLGIPCRVPGTKAYRTFGGSKVAGIEPSKYDSLPALATGLSEMKIVFDPQPT